jgi:hypothetical protein
MNRENFINYYSYIYNLSNELKKDLELFLTELEKYFKIDYNVKQNKIIVYTNLQDIFNFIKDYEDENKNEYLQYIIFESKEV